MTKETYKPTDDDFRLMVNLYEDKVPLTSIGAKFGVNYSTIQARLTALKVPPRKYRDYKLTDKQIDECIAGYRSRKDIVHEPRFSTAKFVKGVKVAPVKPMQGRYRRHTTHLDEVRDCDQSGCMNKTRGRFCADHALKNHRAKPTAPTRGSHFKDANVVRFG